MTYEQKKKEFVALYKKNHEEFVRYCTVLTNCQVATEDLVQEVLAEAFFKFGKIRDTTKFLHFLIRVAKFKYLNGLRKKKFPSYDSEKFNSLLVDKGLNPELLYDIEVLYKALNLLPFKQKEAVILFEIQGYPIKEIAEIQESTEGAVKTKISRGRNKLKHILTPRTSKSITCLKNIIL